MRLGQPPSAATQIREAESRQLQGDEAALLAEAAQVLQDSGYTITESSAVAGVLTGHKDRDATEAGQVATAILIGVLAGPASMRWDTTQAIRAPVTTRPVRNGAARRQEGSDVGTASQTVVMRVSFERLISNNRGETRHEPLLQPELQRDFFDKLRQGLSGARQAA